MLRTNKLSLNKQDLGQLHVLVDSAVWGRAEYVCGLGRPTPRALGPSFSLSLLLVVLCWAAGKRPLGRAHSPPQTPEGPQSVRFMRPPSVRIGALGTPRT